MEKEVSFLNLIESKKIIVPKIQRDYAQGRLNKKVTEIRDGFLSALIDALTSNSSKPLLLDFIYGSTNKFNAFTPLDGQQRLTTLFLLHWYLIPSEELNLLSIEDKNSKYSKFSYETRISSKDFCDALVSNSIVDLKKEQKLLEQNLNKAISLSDIIIDQSWFLWSWKKNPTVKAMLVMLDEMDARLGNVVDEQKIAMWKQLKNKRIAFHLLPLEEFALTDELYVKMNARGKELSIFDIFKSTLEEQMRLNEVDETIQNKWKSNIDSNWIDIFWNKLAKPNINENVNIDEQIKFVESVEEGYMRFFKRMMIFHLFLCDDCLNCDWNSKKIKRYVPFDYDISEKPTENELNSIINEIREYSFNKKKFVNGDVLDLVPLFCLSEFFSDKFFSFIIKFFESVIYSVENFKYDGSELIDGIYFENGEVSIFDAFIAEEIDYENRVQFFALLKYFELSPAKEVVCNNELKDEFNSWMRIIRNLSTNTNTYYYNGYNDFLNSLKAIEKWSNEVYGNKLSIIEYFVKEDNLDGFNGEQLNEEKSKAVLINSSSNWEDVIRKAEEHKYFLGQIRFLLEWSLNNGVYNLEVFKEYLDKIASVFAENGLKPELYQNHIFRNAMMTISDWYLYKNCFMQNSSKNRDWSWKKYLRESSKSINIKTLLGKWDKSRDFQVFCLDTINKNKPLDWRKYFIENPEIYTELLNHKISWWNWGNEEVCLLSKTRWSSKHKELFTFYLHLKFKEESDVYLDSTEEVNPFSAVFNRANNIEFSIKFIPIWGDKEWGKGKYVISTNYKPKLDEMIYNSDNDRWECNLDSSNHKKAQEIINRLNNVE